MRVRGRSQEPFLFPGDLVHLVSRDYSLLEVGRVYAYRSGDSLIAHRLIAHGSTLVFQGDRQPESELVPSESRFWEVVRLLDRPRVPAAERIVAGLLKVRESLGGWRQPLGSTYRWPLKEMNLFCRRHGWEDFFCDVVGALAIELPRECLLPSAQPASTNNSAFSWQNLGDSKSNGRMLFDLYRNLKSGDGGAGAVWRNPQSREERMIWNQAILRINEWWNENFATLPAHSRSERLQLELLRAQSWWRQTSPEQIISFLRPQSFWRSSP